MDMRSLLHLWFGLRTPVKRLPYAMWGSILMVLKYVVDSLVLRSVGVVWTPLDYLAPLGDERLRSLAATPGPVLWGLVIWTLPFVWIGASMTIRRAANAGLEPWTGLVFFFPVINYLVMVWLCFLPQAGAKPASGDEAGGAAGSEAPSGGFGSAVRAILAAAVVGVAMTATSIFLLESYGAGLFVGTPFVLGFVCGVLANRPERRSLTETIATVTGGLAALGGLLMVVAVEGLVCIAMAFPLAWVLAVVGALMGRGTMAAGLRTRPGTSVMILLLPETVTAVEIDAPPEVVWEYVVGFGELPPPSRWVFRLGIAYPMRARLEGSGAGAVRYCEFSTGAFVEPITVWDPPRRLAFDVAAQPPPLHEWSPYQTVHAPHLLDGFRSERGEFRMIALPDGRTRLEGSTWYRLDLFPQPYWTLFSDALVHRIHQRVLEHVRDRSEEDQPSLPGTQPHPRL
jgi:hypothetical protein